MSATEATQTRVYQEVVDRFDGHGPRCGNMHRYSKLRCGHLTDHGPMHRIDRPLPQIGATVCCRTCTKKARTR